MIFQCLLKTPAALNKASKNLGKIILLLGAVKRPPYLKQNHIDCVLHVACSLRKLYAKIGLPWRYPKHNKITQQDVTKIKNKLLSKAEKVNLYFKVLEMTRVTFDQLASL